MRVVSTVAELRETRRALGTVGFVPTMGYLHEGHLSLVRAARVEAEASVVSIFVNPTQFGPNEDLSRYPRDLERDLALLQGAGCDLVFTPGVEDMYPAGFATSVEVDGITSVLEGAVRPGHFGGVATVVAKLINMVQPTVAWFGQKDAQQVAVIRRMAADLDLPCRIAVGPTVREADGLALSSRNVYLDTEQRAAAPVLFRALSVAGARYDEGERDGEALRRVMLDMLDREPLARVDYVSLAHPENLTELERIGPEGALVSLAARFGTTRLIDNIVLR